LDTSTQTIATFTGTLLRREHNVGQKFVQLVFREHDKNWLCISSKLSDTKLTIGQNYRIEGIFRQLGDRAYIHEPKIALSKRQVPLRRMIIAAGIIVGVTVLGGGAFAATHTSGNDAQNLTVSPASAHTTVQTTAPTSDTTAEQQQPATDATPAATTPAAVTTTIVKKTSSAASKATTTPTTTVQTTPVVTTPSADDTTPPTTAQPDPTPANDPTQDTTDPGDTKPVDPGNTP
jgi:hypothetical protein